MIQKEAFREYDVRGAYPDLINEELAYKMARAYAYMVKKEGKNTCVVGHDNRLSSPSLKDSLLKGLVDAGMHVKFLGLVTTPMYYYASLKLGIDTGIMVTASHNPKCDNGFKIALRNNDNACGRDILDIYDNIMKENFASGTGSIENVDIYKDYIREVLKDINIGRKLKIVVDPANGTGSIICKEIYDRLNVDVTYINEISDGNFPNHHPDPSVKENMIELSNKVKELHADLGIAFDGDADRVGFVDERGEIIPADIFMAIMCASIIPSASNKIVLFDVKCSKALEDEIKRLGGIPFIYRTGNSYQKNKVKEMDLSIGGELSGHVFFRDKWKGFDDGIYAGVRFLELLSNEERTASALYSHLNKYYSTSEIKVHCDETKKEKVMKTVLDYVENKGYEAITIDGVRAYLKSGWALVRKSNTGPNLTMRFEAAKEEDLKLIQDEFTNLVNETINN